MAIIKLNPIISDIKGSFSGVTFQNSRAGTILKQKQVYQSSKSERQSNIKSINNYLHNIWYNFTDTQRNYYSKLSNFSNIKQKNNVSRVLSGYELFMKNNFYFVIYEQTIISQPSFYKYKLSQPVGDLNLNLGSLYFRTDRLMDSSIEFIILFCTKPLQITRNNPGSTYRLILFETTDTDTFDITTLYSNLFGNLPADGQKVFFKYTIADKQSSCLLPFVTKYQTTF